MLPQVTGKKEEQLSLLVRSTPSLLSHKIFQFRVLGATPNTQGYEAVRDSLQVPQMRAAAIFSGIRYSIMSGHVCNSREVAVEWGEGQVTKGNWQVEE